MNENEFWLGIWKVLATVLILLTITISSCTSYNTNKVSETINNGVPPLEAKCALNSVSTVSTDSVCNILAAQK